MGYAEQLGLDVERFGHDLDEQVGAARIAEDVDGADLSSVSGTPTFFVNGRVKDVSFGMRSLFDAVEAALRQR